MPTPRSVDVDTVEDLEQARSWCATLEAPGTAVPAELAGVSEAV